MNNLIAKLLIFCKYNNLAYTIAEFECVNAFMQRYMNLSNKC